MPHPTAHARLLLRYVLLVSALAAGAAAWAATTAPAARPFAAPGWSALLLAALVALAGALPLTLTPTLKVHVATVPQFAAMLLFPVPQAAAVALLGVLAYQGVLGRRGRRTLLDTVFNGAQTILQVVAGGTLFARIAGGAGSPASADALAGALAAALGVYAVNMVVVCGAAGLSLGRDPLALWLAGLAREAPQHAAQFVLGFLAALVAADPAFALAALLSVAAAYYALYLGLRVRAETCSSVEAMADAVDRRVFGGPGHSRRVAEVAAALAAALRLRPDDVALVRQAARVHDIGLIGIADELLARPGPLGREERAVVEGHVAIGVALLARFPEYERCRHIVQAHHEQPDGRGYPQGVAGAAIPRLAAIVKVADAFEALTAPRPYRPAMPAEDALAVLRAGRGREWDAAVVDAALVALAPVGTAPALLAERAS